MNIVGFKKILSLLLAICLIFSLLNSVSMLTASASGSNPDIISFHISSTEDWAAVKFLSHWQTFPAGNYKATVKLKKLSGGEPYLKIGKEYETSDISVMTNYATSFDSTNNLYTITFTLTSSWGGNLGWYIGNYGRITSFIVAKPTLYLLDSSGNPTGSNYAVDFAADNYCTSRTGDKWLKAGIYSNLVTFSDYNEDVFAPEIPQDTTPKMLKLGGAGGGMQALCYETKLSQNTHYRFDLDYRGCGGASAYKSIEVINASGKYETPTKDNRTLNSRTDSGTNLTVCFRVPNNAESGKNHFRLYVGQCCPQKKNGIAYFANFSLRTADNGVAYGSNNIIVLIPHFYYCPAEFRAAFGDHCVDFVKVACSDEGFSYEGISKTSKDTEFMSQNRIPPSFRLNNSETDVHLNAYGYDLVAHLIYEQGKKLNYFS